MLTKGQLAWIPTPLESKNHRKKIKIKIIYIYGNTFGGFDTILLFFK
jgi:hypothetical protein